MSGPRGRRCAGGRDDVEVECAVAGGVRCRDGLGRVSGTVDTCCIIVEQLGEEGGAGGGR